MLKSFQGFPFPYEVIKVVADFLLSFLCFMQVVVDTVHVLLFSGYCACIFIFKGLKGRLYVMTWI